MKLTELIQKLETIKAEFGDIEAYITCYETLGFMDKTKSNEENQILDRLELIL